MLWLVEGRKLAAKPFNREICNPQKLSRAWLQTSKNWMKFWSHKDFFSKKKQIFKHWRFLLKLSTFGFYHSIIVNNVKELLWMLVGRNPAFTC